MRFEVLFGEEIKKTYMAEASRYYGLYADQASRAMMSPGEFTGWRATHTYWSPNRGVQGAGPAIF